MTKTAVGSEEPEDNKPVEGQLTSFPANVTIASNGDVLITYMNNAVGDIGTQAVTGATYFLPKTKVRATPKPLFGNWVEKTKEMQEEFFGQKFEYFTHQQLVEWIRINVLAAEDELHEALDEVSWKPWASSEFFHREAYLGEIVDVLHFVGNLLAGAGITDEELNAAYLEKMERNRQRQRDGYTGLDKCSGCKRAIDDIIAHGGKMVQGDEFNQWCDSCTDGPPVGGEK